ncbi:MAG: PAS domain S-box protein [Terriglobia bacterium]
MNQLMNAFKLLLGRSRMPLWIAAAGIALLLNGGLVYAAPPRQRPAPYVLLQSVRALTSPWLILLMGLVILVLAVRLLTLGSKEHEYAEFVRRAMQREAQHERRYRELLDNSSDIVYTHDLDGKLITWSKAGELISGYTQREVFQKNIAALALPEQREAVHAWVRQISEGRGPAMFELVISDKEGSPVTLDVSTRAITHEGRPAGILGFARDITARKRAEEALKQSELRLRTVVANVPVILFAVDRMGVFTLCEGKGLEALGLKPGSLAGRSVHDLDRFLPGIGSTFSRAISGESFTATHEAGGLIYEGQVTPVRDSRGEVNGLIGIATEVTERKKSEEATEKARKAAEAASRAKSEFLANMSHEIRTPMNGILGMTDLALETELTAEQREYLDTVKLSGEALMTVINDVLDFSKIEAGKLDFEEREFDLRDLLESTLKPFVIKGRQKGLKVYCNIQPNVPVELLGDSGRLRQLLTNLLGNAIKFTAQGSVKVGVEAEVVDGNEALLRFEVADTGIGIPQDKQGVIFEAFAQADGSTTRKYGGTGLGLTITKRIVEMMGGAIGVESEPDRGSNFYFTLAFPLSQALPPASAPPQVESSRDDSAFEMAHSARPETKGRVVKILLVEDHPANQKLARFLLEKYGYRVEAANDGMEAIAALQKEASDPFDLVLMDIQMPRMDGFEATAMIRRMQKGSGKRVPVVAMTAHAMKGDKERCLKAGMDGYISKPVRRSEIIGTIERFTGWRTRIVEAPAAARLPVFNLEESVERLGGNRKLLCEMAGIFLKATPAELANMRPAISDNDREKLKRSLRTLESALGAFSGGAALQSALDLENEISQNQPQRIIEAFQRLEKQIDDLSMALAELVRSDYSLSEKEPRENSGPRLMPM